MKKQKTLFFFIGVCCFVMFMSCNDDDNKIGSESGYNPALPVEVNTFTPVSGRIREKVVITGSNFGNDKSKVKVFFKDEFTEREATVIGVNNTTIYCLAPRQLAGENTIKVVANERDAACDETFQYTVAENVSLIAGAGASSERKTVDGTLTEARFNFLHGIAALGNEAVLIFQRGQWNDDPAVRYVSIQDNAVITVHKGFLGGKPAVSKDKTKVYAAGCNLPHTIYMYTKESGWSPTRIGELGVGYDRIRALTFSDNEEWLYFCDQSGKFGRFEIATQQIEVLKEKLDIIIPTQDAGYLIYSPFDECFYLSVQNAYGVYLISKDGQTATPFAGFNGNRTQDGYLNDCSFTDPQGMTLDEDGNIYILDKCALRKISVINGYVSTVAGNANVEAQVDGNPIDARLAYPYDIANDGEGNYWIAEGWGCALRKYAVE